MMSKFELQDDVQPVFKKKRNVPFASLEQINEEFVRLVNTGVLSKLEYSEWAAPTDNLRDRRLRWFFYGIKCCTEGLSLPAS